MLQLVQLVALPLWGRYKGVKLFLELTEDRKTLRRFVVFVRHPQSFFYVRGSTERTQAWRTHFGRPQDLLLSVAARLAGIQIEPHFYEFSPRLCQNLCVQRTVTQTREIWKAQARAQLKIAFPDACLSTEKSRRIFVTREDREGLPEVNQFMAGQITKSVNLSTRSEIADDKAQRETRNRKIAAFWHELNDLITMFMPETSFNIQTDNNERLITAIEASDWTELYDWDELPEVLTEFIDEQDGLRIDRRPISSRKELETAYALLQCKGSLGALSIVGLAFSVLIAYAWKITRPRKTSVDSLLVLGTPPRNVVSRKCSGCGGRVLDDAFAYYAKVDPDVYILWRLQNTCGLPSCTQQGVDLVPFDGWTKHSRPNRDELIEICNIWHEAAWAKYFLRTPAECGDLPRRVEIQCLQCGKKETKARPRWTPHTPPRLLKPIQKCSTCSIKRVWKPVDTKVLTIGTSSLSRLWASFKKDGCDLAEYPRMPDVYFSSKYSLTQRIAQLKEAKKMLEQIRVM
ncbi:hypothetical protein NUU61_008828 [Penicillium alfredii]|uniref:Uncharacterized protein n=1 Tax=Penicillium alfredii TaxID=1506179 RepID=A0A9W9EM58_9EURO|nr:uncharacterized protein NUU61_008828 [Penicillium alfredii]KAJ5084249.1 hypothetical protein NUU61_008828 [Penicillium alfredii]